MSRDCFVALPRGAVGLSVVCDFGISLSYLEPYWHGYTYEIWALWREYLCDCKNTHTHCYCKFGNFREYFIFANSVKRRICGVKDSWLGHDLLIDFELKKVLLPPPPLGNFADIPYLEENFKPHLLRDVCTLCSGALVSYSLLHMLL